jgi:hypothetical protein
MGWLQNYTWLTYNKPHSEWDYNSCKEEASKYSNRNEFGKSAYGAYTCARKNGWLDDFYPIPLRRYFDYDTCKRMVSKYQSLNDLLINDRSLYESIRKKGWLDNFFPKDKTTKENKNK